MSITNLIKLTQEGEQWEQIKDFPNYYVSSYGRVYGTGKNHIEKGEYSKRGYRSVRLYSAEYPNGKKIKVARLVAAAFCDGYSDDKEIHHCDLDVKDDKASNLLPVTHDEHVAIHRAINRFILALCDMVQAYKKTTDDESEVAAA